MRRIRRPPATTLASAAAVLLVALGTACGSGRTGSAPPPTPNGGIDLLTVAAPTCPVQRKGQVCERPLSVRVLVRDSAGRTVATVQTGADGTARVPLAPGSYELVPQSGASGFPRAPQPSTVAVEAGAFTPVTISYDTGIR